MAVLENFSAAWRAGRVEKSRQRSGPSVAVRLARYAARKLPTLKRFRTAIMQITGLGCIDFAVFQWSFIWGFIALGVSLIILEALGGER